MPKLNYDILNLIDDETNEDKYVESKVDDIYYTLYSKVNEINNIFSLFVNNLDVDDYKNSLITKIGFNDYVKSCYLLLSEKSNNDEVNNEDILSVYKELYKDFLGETLKHIFSSYKDYNNTQNDKLIISSKEIKSFMKNFDDLNQDLYLAITNTRMPSMGNMTCKEFTLFIEDTLSFKVLEEKEHTNINNLNRQIKDNLSQNAYNNALNILSNKPNILVNDKKSVTIDNLNSTTVDDYLLKLRYEYKEIERIHSTRSFWEKIFHPYNYIHEKNMLKNIIKKTKKIFKNTNASIKVEGIISGDDKNYHLTATRANERIQKTNYLSDMFESLDEFNNENKFGIDLENRNYEEFLKYKKNEKIHNVIYNEEKELISNKNSNEQSSQKEQIMSNDKERKLSK